ncbi:hypothetical protein GQX73_g9882 [Xylaria multiplex]|uniref:Uncharacterized protein n=1 Tax=Xylaria multiplex TaxID=323545 RepID=A0A7C8ITS7_9PEZI|nr:hypothetical protein GQX73_g9882 [Xylaria multiplex]
MKTQDWARELNEFVSCARIFKPMTGLMASRFTTSTAKLAVGGKGDDLIHTPEKPKDPAEEAARLGMYGTMTRSVKDFYPTRLLCKRFNVRPPAHVQPDADLDAETGNKTSSTVSGMGMAAAGGGAMLSEGAVTLDELMRQAQTAATLEASTASQDAARESGIGDSHSETTQQQAPLKVNADVNEALEGKRAQEEVLRAIFGDSSDEED